MTIIEQHDYSQKVGFTIGMLEQLIRDLEEFPSPETATYSQYADAIRIFGQVSELTNN
jgi:hypothetical protein